MKISTLMKPADGLHLYTRLVEMVAEQHGLTAEGSTDLLNRVTKAINERTLQSRDPASSMVVGDNEPVTPLVRIDDFNVWLKKNHSKHLTIAVVVAPTIRIPRGRLAPSEVRDRALRLYRQLGFHPPSNRGETWQGTTKLAEKIGWGSRQYWKKILVLALEQEGRKKTSATGFGRGK